MNIVITGSTSGIGKELVKEFLSEDNILFAGYRNSELISPQNNVEYFYIDMTDRKSIVEAANFIKSKVDKIDLLINVAGSVVAGPIETMDTDRLRQQFDINTFSHIELTQNLLPVLKNGRVINISSMASFGIFPFISPYCASKRALDILFNAFDVENQDNIKVISIKPGVIATPIWEKAVKSNSESLVAEGKYGKEMNFLKDNALKNSNRGLKVEKVAKFIKKVATSKNPKSSYVIGFDAWIAMQASKLSQDMINFIMRMGLKYKFREK